MAIVERQITFPLVRPKLHYLPSPEACILVTSTTLGPRHQCDPAGRPCLLKTVRGPPGSLKEADKPTPVV